MYKIYDFNILSKNIDDSSSMSDEEINTPSGDKNTFIVQMFGINEEGKSASIYVDEFKPFFYMKVSNSWTKAIKNDFMKHIRSKMGKYYHDSLIDGILIKRRKLYGYDNKSLHKFIKLTFANVPALNKAKNLFFEDVVLRDGSKERKLIRPGYKFANTNIEIYESNIPPLLRFFHIKDISPSGWIELPKTKIYTFDDYDKKTTCDYEYKINYNNIISLPDKETTVPYKKLSFDIEASSSHGDFPVPIKSYKKLATNIIEYIDKNEIHKSEQENVMKNIILSAFNYDKMDGIDLVYPKHKLNKQEVINNFNIWKNVKVRDYNRTNDDHIIERMFQNTLDKLKNENDNENDNEDDYEHDKNAENNTGETVGSSEVFTKQDALLTAYDNATKISNTIKDYTIMDVIYDNKTHRDMKLTELIYSLRSVFPALEGDKVTFIGSTFSLHGDDEPYLNHCIVLNTCDKLLSANTVIETYSTEREVLLAWTRLMQRENCDVVMGYNIFGFDYEFMFRRAQELNCVEEFLQLSKNKDEICANIDRTTNKLDIQRSSTVVASGAYETSIISMPGRLQIDMLHWFRKNENLTSYKLDYVGGYYIGDTIKSIEHTDTTTQVYTNNMIGLQKGNFIHFELINHSSDYYKNGSKFEVINIDRTNKFFEINGLETPTANKIKWGLAKDDITPKQIFEYTNGSSYDRSIIAKYCIQDCNLVQHLFNKVDVMTSLIEMSKLCSVPMSFLISRGQGIKLTSYVAKQCRNMNVLMPVIDKGSNDDGYEGAIVLPPKTGFYMDPINIGDYASLYPSSMLSENLCPSSKVWTKTFNLENNIIEEVGVKNRNGDYIYDNLPGKEYVNITFDTYRWVKNTPKGKAVKMKSGYKICRYIQPEKQENGEDERAIMPTILQSLLKARKDTRKKIKTTSDNFMKNVLDKRQLTYKITANSLYGQLGAKTSTFYEPDIAASTTATGRLLLTYSKRIIEECYGDTVVTTKDGSIVHTKAEYVYGDTDSVFWNFNLTDETSGEKITGQRAVELTIELSQTATNMVSMFLKPPHDFEYEKTFKPFGLLSRKRYFAMKYEFDPNPEKATRCEMGIVLKRRDNAPIVKDVYGGVVDILMKEQNIKKAIDFIHCSLAELSAGNISMDKLIITKSLRSFYANPQSIAHKVLADRIGVREPGNKPASGDRIAFVYFVPTNVNSKVKILQGDKIETPTFIKNNKLLIDYSFYITNQLMKPLSQLLGLVLEDMWLMEKIPKRGKVAAHKKEIEEIKKQNLEAKKIESKIGILKDKEVKKMIFDKYLIEIKNKKMGNQQINNFFKLK